MRYAKLNANGTLALAPYCVTYDGKQIFNPSTDVLLALGYKPITDTPYPEQEEGTEPISYTVHYEEQENEIVQVWEEAVPITPAVDVQQLKAQLGESDYKVIKCAEYQLAGLPLPYKLSTLHAERQAIRDQINKVVI